MALLPATKIGPYDIVALLGAGGMGEVYRARDPKLQRDVAIKVLPEIFADDPERLARFEREAKALAALSHANIAHVYGIEESAGVHALVMELVEGDTLADRIARGPLPLDEALPIARQIAEALEAAHERGIVHRDLKPANIKIAPDGTVKILDFGLAKALAPSSGSDVDIMNSPTLTGEATQLGVILGTAAYMAPEQARGRPVDRRADIWAFGVVMFEMLTGRVAFAGDTLTDIMAAIVTREPDWAALSAAMPSEIRQLLERCLDKDAKRRLRDIGEARVAIEAALAGGPRVRDVPRRAPSRGWFGSIVMAGGLIAAAVAGYALGQRRHTGSPSPAMLTSFTQLTDQPGVERQPTISPDGKTIVFVSAARGNDDLYLLRVGGRKTILLTEDSNTDDYAPAFSPDGTRIAFRSERAGGGIFLMEATGESVRRITDQGFDPRWSPDGTRLVVADETVADPMSRVRVSALWIVTVADGTRRRVATGDAVGARWSPSGRRIAYWGRDRDAQRDIWTVASDGSDATPRSVTSDAAIDWSPAWAPDGRHLYFASNRGGTMNLWRVGIDENSGQLLGPPQPVTTPSAWSGEFEFSSNGRSLIFADQDERARISVVAFDPMRGAIVGQPRAVLQGRAINSIDLSPDGTTIAFAQRGQPWEALGIVRTDGSGWSRLTDGAYYHRIPKWSPDGKLLAFYMNRGNRLWTVRPDGSDLREVPVTAHWRERYPVYPVWSPDGSRIAAATDGGLLVTPATSTAAMKPTHFDGSSDFLPFDWSRDGRWLAGTGRRAAGVGSQLMLLDPATGATRGLERDGKSPVWLSDSRRLLYSAPSHLALLDVATGREERLLPLARTARHWAQLVAISGDERTIAYLEPQSDGDIWLMTFDRTGQR